MWVFKTTAFEPRSQKRNPNKNPRFPYREIVQKLFKFRLYIRVYRFEQFLDDFSVQRIRILFWIYFLWSWFKCGRFEYPHRVLSNNLNFHFCYGFSSFQMALNATFHSSSAKNMNWKKILLDKVISFQIDV